MAPVHVTIQSKAEPLIADTSKENSEFRQGSQIDAVLPEDMKVVNPSSVPRGTEYSTVPNWTDLSRWGYTIYVMRF